MIEQKLSELRKLLDASPKSLTSALEIAAQIAELRGDADYTLLFECHLRGLNQIIPVALQSANPHVATMFYDDRKQLKGEKSLTGSLAILELAASDLDKDIESASAEVLKARSSYTQDMSTSSSLKMQVASTVLGNFRQSRSEFTEIFSRIRMRITKYVGKVENENLQAAAARSNVRLAPNDANSKKVFVVHGHNNEVKQTVARFLETLGLEPIILHEQASRGATLIEKFERHSDVGFAVVLLTPDDLGGQNSDKPDLKSRARQNVVFELGFFYARLSRSRVCAMLAPGVEKPSDIDGIVYINLDISNGGWQLDLARELRAADLNIDLNKLSHL